MIQFNIIFQKNGPTPLAIDRGYAPRVSCAILRIWLRAKNVSGSCRPAIEANVRIHLKNKTMKIAEIENALLRTARPEDMASIDEITIICYTPINESYVNMLGEDC